jgi:ATP-binding cassette subfamily B protein
VSDSSNSRAAPTAAAASERAKSRELGHLRHLWPFVKPHGSVLVSALAALLVAAGATLAIGQALRRVIDSGFQADNAAFLDQYFLALFGVVVVLAASTFARFYCVSWLGERVVAAVRSAVYDRVIGLSPAYFETARTGEILSRLTTDTEQIQSVVGSSASLALRNFLLLIGGTALLFVTSVKLALLILLIVPLVVVPILVFGRRVRRLSRASQDRIADVSAYASETLNAVETVQAFAHEAHDRRRFGAAVEEAFVAAVRRINARAWLTALVILLIFGAVDAVMWIGARDVAQARISGGTLAAFVFYAIVVAGSAGALSEVYGDFQRAAGAAERLVELLRTPIEIRAPAHPTPLALPARGAIAFERVGFRYPSRPEADALSDFDLGIAPGERVALVGPSGAGKSTVFRLLLRFHDPEAGRITFDGVPLPDLDPQVLRGAIGVVAQDPAIFAATAIENIRYGRPEASDDEVEAAAEAAQAAGFIARLPEGFHTFLGERGVRLSGGQRQRIAIARAILRNPALLLLDEATSALDSESEHKVQAALEPLMRGRTTLVIAHRLATVLGADRIVVIDSGRIVAQGKHDQLMAAGGLYTRLATLQFNVGQLALGRAAQ